MQDLNYGLKRLVFESKDGSHSTRAARKHILIQAADTLHELGYKKLKPEGLKPKHVEALVARWKAEQLSAGTIKNRMSHLRWWAGAVGKPAIIARENEFYQIEKRTYVTGENKARDLDEEKLAKVTDQYTRMSLRMQAAFGLRREEAIKFSPTYADKGDRITLKPSWTKGGRAREIPIRNEAQRQLLDEVHRFAGRGALIPGNKNYVQQMRTYERNTVKAGLDRNHGLRHAYAQTRYEELTGWECPAVGGPDRKTLTPEQRERDIQAREKISAELGHSRPQIVAQYCS